MTPTLRTVAADAVAPADLHAAFTRAFADYLIGPFAVPLAQWPQFTGRQAVDLAASRVALRGDDILAFAFVAPRPALATWRLATMGAVPEARGTGAAAGLLDDFIARARAAHMKQVELECFAQNERALRLYRGRGFEPVHELFGYVREAGAGIPAPAVHASTLDAGAQAGEPPAVALDEAFAWLDRIDRARGDLPLQVTPVSLGALPVQLQAWRRGTAQLVFSRNDAGVLTMHSLIDEDAAQSDAEALVRELVQRHRADRIVVPQLQRDDLGGQALQRAGFARQPLHQLLCRRRLDT